MLGNGSSDCSKNCGRRMILWPKTSPRSMRSGQMQMHRLSLWRPRSYNFDSSCTLSTKSSMLHVKDNGIGLCKKIVIAELSKMWNPLFARTSRRSRSAEVGSPLASERFLGGSSSD